MTQKKIEKDENFTLIEEEEKSPGGTREGIRRDTMEYKGRTSNSSPIGPIETY